MRGAREILSQLRTRWERGYFLSGLETLFPYEYRLPVITSRQMSQEYDRVRDYSRELSGHPRLSPYLRYQEVNHRLLGRNRLPVALCFESAAQLAAVLGKSQELERFTAMLKILEGHDSRLSQWAMHYPLRLLEVDSETEKLLLLWQWMSEHPRPGIYLRQIDLPGIDTKFTERHKGILSQWLDATLDTECIDETYKGVSGFERRYGYLSKPELVRFRILDKELSFHGCDDITIPSRQFCELFDPSEPIPFERVFVIENDICALSMPPLAKSLVLFGRGYHFDHLRACRWLHDLDIHYWGDIDTHGFAILDQFRSLFGHTRSLLMDERTLLAHPGSWGEEPKPCTAELSNLEHDEYRLYERLVTGSIRKNLRLEQELISFGWVESELARLMSR